MDYVQLDKQTAQRMGRATLAVEKLGPQTLLPRRGPRNGGGGGGGDGLIRVMVYDNLEGGTFNDAGEFLYGPVVRCLPVVSVTGGEAPNLDAAFIEAKWRSGSSLDLSETGCCGEDAAVAPSGILIDTGLGADGNDRVYDSDANSGAVVISGTGVAADATITVTITDGTTTLTPTPVVNNGDGTWAAPSQSLSTLVKGVVKVTATDLATTDVRVITYSKGDDSTQRGFFTGRPTRPDMTAATDLGASDTDNTTSDTTPTFSCAHGGVSPIDAGGPIPRLYIKGVLVQSGDVNSYTTTPPVVSSVDLTPASPLDAGRQNAQLVLEWDDTSEDAPFWSPPSLGLRINIDEDATEETEPAIRYCRLGWLSGEFVTVDKCRRPLTDAEITKLDA